jgi:hypothetical protein
MHIQVITFKLDGIDDAAYQTHAEQSAPGGPAARWNDGRALTETP